MDQSEIDRLKRMRDNDVPLEKHPQVGWCGHEHGGVACGAVVYRTYSGEVCDKGHQGPVLKDSPHAHRLEESLFEAIVRATLYEAHPGRCLPGLSERETERWLQDHFDDIKNAAIQRLTGLKPTREPSDGA